MFRKIVGISVLLASVSGPVLADTLPDVLGYAYQNSSYISAERAGQKAVDENVAKARSGYRPTIYGEGSYGRSYNKLDYTDPSVPDGQKVYLNPNDVSLRFNQPIFSGLTTVQSVKAAKNQVKSSRHGLMNTEQAVLLDSTAVYMDVVRDEAVLDLRRNNESVLKKHLDSYRKRLKAGDLTRTDVAQAEARHAGAVAQRIAAEGNLQVAKANFSAVVNMDANNLTDVNDVPAGIPKTLEEAMDLALQDNPKILAAQYAKEAAHHTTNAKKGVLAPSINVGGAVGRQKEQMQFDKSDYWQVSAKLTVPLYQSGLEHAEIREAKQLENKYRILWDKTVHDVRAEVIGAWEYYQSSRAQMASIRSQIKASKMALDGVIREAKVGSRTVLDVLDAEQEHLDNQVALVKVHREEIVSAYALLSAVGRMNPQNLGLNVDTYDPKAYYEDVKGQWFGWWND